MERELLLTGPDDAPLLVLGHGAGAQMTSPFMELISNELAARGIAVARFEFGYMAARRAGGKPRPPPKADKLNPEYEDVIGQVKARWPERAVFIGGKSMGGRVASMIADGAYTRGDVSGLVCLGYPFHPPAKTESWRTAHLAALACRALIVQGERDPFGSRKEVEALTLSPSITFHWAADGDHDLGPRGSSGFTRKGNLAAAADAVAAFVMHGV